MKLKFYLFCFVATASFAAEKHWYGQCAEPGICTQVKVKALKIEPKKGTGGGSVDCFEVRKDEKLSSGERLLSVAHYDCYVNEEMLIRIQPGKPYEVFKFIPGIVQ